MLNTRCVRWVDIVLYSKLHLHKELQSPQHGHQWYPQLHTNQHYRKVTQISIMIFQFGCWYMGERNWHDRVYGNPLLILEASWTHVCKSQRFLPLHMCDSCYEKWTLCIFQNSVYKLFRVMRLSCFIEEKFTPTKPLTWWTTFLKW
jgi:hypothetical protein